MRIKTFDLSLHSPPPRYRKGKWEGKGTETTDCRDKHLLCLGWLVVVLESRKNLQKCVSTFQGMGRASKHLPLLLSTKNPEEMSHVQEQAHQEHYMNTIR